LLLFSVDIRISRISVETESSAKITDDKLFIILFSC